MIFKSIDNNNNNNNNNNNLLVFSSKLFPDFQMKLLTILHEMEEILNEIVDSSSWDICIMSNTCPGQSKNHFN